MRAHLASSLALLICAGLSAQTFTSPEGAATMDGGSNSGYPFSAASNRFQQTMTDQKGSPKVFTSLAFRPDQGYSCGSCTARTVEVRITMAHTDITKLTTTFASNYVGTATVVFTRKKVSLPARKGPYANLPKPDFTFKFDKMFAFDGKQDFLIDVQTYNNDGAGNSYYGDYANRVYAERKTLGTGCTATGQTSAMSLTSYCSSQVDSTSGNAAHRFYWSASRAVNNAPSLIMVGLKNLNASVPGLCTKVYTDLVLALPFTASSSGSFSTIFYVPFEPGWVGGTVYAQALCLDTGQTGIPFALSNGVSSKLVGRVGPARRVQHFSDGDSKTGAGPYSNQLVVIFNN